MDLAAASTAFAALLLFRGCGEGRRNFYFTPLLHPQYLSSKENQLAVASCCNTVR